MAPTPSTEPSSRASTPDNASNQSKYRLRVTAGTAYNTSTHRVVAVNSSETITFETASIVVSLAVRVRKFTGFPQSSPETSSYFSHPLHKSDQYSISFSFIPKVDIPGTDLVFGNDFDRPIRDRLPPGFNQAFKIVKWFIDPGLEGDVQADTPYLYGPALSSWNILRIGDKIIDTSSNTSQKWQMPNSESFHEIVVEEGGEGTGEEIREEYTIPAESSARKKYFLIESNLEAFTFEAGRLYQSDFGNPYLDFNDFSLKLPGYSLNVIKYVDSKTHELRYTLKNKITNEVYCVVLFTLLFGDELREMEARAERGEDHHQDVTTQIVRAAAGKNVPLNNAFGDEPAPADDDVD